MLFASHSVLILHDIYNDASLSISDCINRASDVDWQRIIRLNEIDWFCRKLCMAEACGMIAGNGSSGTAR